MRWTLRPLGPLSSMDIEALLHGRYMALQEGIKAQEQIQNLLCLQQQQKKEQETTPFRFLSDADCLRLLWRHQDRFRQCIQQASKRTGETNLWQTHNFYLPPPDPTWLQHVQITAYCHPATTTTTTENEKEETTEEIVGFCEIAMLFNPLMKSNNDHDDDDDDAYDPIFDNDTVGRPNDNFNNNNQEEDVDENDDHCRRSTTWGFSPGIVNFATAPQWRRQGVGRQLLQFSKRYVQMQWKTTTSPSSTTKKTNTNLLGLYVEKDNHAAVALYETQGFQKRKSCPGGPRLGPMWYMTCPSSSSSRNANNNNKNDPKSYRDNNTNNNTSTTTSSSPSSLSLSSTWVTAE